MNQLQARDLQQVLAVGKTALECDDLADLQEQTLRLMEGCVGATSGVYLGISGNSRAWRFESGLAHGVPDEGPQVWCSDYCDRDPFVSRFLNNPAGKLQVVISTEVMSHAEFVRTRFYRQFLKPQSVYHIMILGLTKDGVPIGLFGLHRPVGAAPFSRKEAAIADLLSPYLSAAVQKIQARDKADEREFIIKELATGIQHTGVVILDHDGAPIGCYGNAAELLRIRADKCDQAGTLELPQQITAHCEKVKQALSWRHNNEFHEWFTIEQPSGAAVNVHLHPYDCGAKGLRFMVYLGAGQPAKQPEIVRSDQLERYKLTRRQIDIVNLVSLGMTNPEVADRLCISVRTVQNHLRSIYLKVNVHNRTSLVSKLARTH